MPVVLGDTTTVSGSGTWPYPHAGLVVGLVLHVTDPDTAGRFYGTEILRARELGVWAPVSEAGPLHSLPLWNADEVTYDIGHSPTAVSWDLLGTVSLQVTEILSEAPPPPGGGAMTACQASMSSFTGVPDSSNLPLDMDTLVFNTDTANYTFSSGAISVANAGIYRISWHCKLAASATPSRGVVTFQVNGGAEPEQAAIGVVATDNTAYASGYSEWQLASGDVVKVQIYQSSGVTQLATYADLTLSTG